jgi:hypothetical protein
MEEKKGVPGIVQIVAWLLSLIVFAVGFWHTHLGLKEMKPFGSEWGGLAIAGIVLLLMLITYWYAVNGKKMALIFYIVCGIIFFICNLNYFYPSYMARTLVKEEAAALKDTIDRYAGKSTKFTNEALSKFNKITEYSDEIIFQIKSNHGFGEKAKNALLDFNEVTGTKIPPPNDVLLDEQQINDWKEKLDKEVEKWLLANMGDGVLKGIRYAAGLKTLDSLQKNAVPELEKIAIDDTPMNLDSIKFHPDVKTVKSVVEKINSSAINVNEGTGKETIKELPKDLYPNANRLGEIQNTILTIGKRINQISTWAIIILCLFIDLVVPLAIYLLLRKKEGEDSSNDGGFFSSKPDSF